ncbi:MAG: permease [Acidobacteriaceae bacterium]
MTPAIFNPRAHSLIRANVFVFASVIVATLLSSFPYIRANPWLVLPFFVCLVGMADTVRCIQKRWNFYHGGVMFCLYMDLLAITLILFFLVYPYLVGIGKS